MSRKAGTIVLALVGVLLAAMVVFNLVVEPPVAAAGPTPKALVGAIVGQVEVRARGAERWDKVEPKSALAEGDEIRTGLFSEVNLHLRGASSVVIGPNTTFVVGQEMVERSSFKLEEGTISAAIPEESSREYQFRSRGSEAIASIGQGEFSMATDGKGTVVVDTHKGKVDLKAKGKSVEIRKGRRSVVLPDKPPSKVLAVPASVALQVRWPPTKIDRTRTKISGKTSIAASVLVNGILVRADEQGEFSLNVPLQEGKNRVVVTSTDPSGESSSKQSPEILVDTKPPDVKVDAEGLWK